jgi:hypothetical protein
VQFAAPLTGGEYRAAGVQRGGGRAEADAGVDEADQGGDFQATGLAAAADGGDLLFVRIHEQDAPADPVRVSEVGFAGRLPDLRRDVLRDGRDTTCPAGRPWMPLRRGAGATMFLRRADGGGEVGGRDDLGHLMDPGVRGTVPSPLRCFDRSAMPLPSLRIITTAVCSFRPRARWPARKLPRGRRQCR